MLRRADDAIKGWLITLAIIGAVAVVFLRLSTGQCLACG
jgi:hypothetical protein